MSISDGADKTYGGVPPVIFELTKLKSLNLRFHGIYNISEHFSSLKDLTEFNVSNNPVLENIAAELGKLPLKCKQNHKWILLHELKTVINAHHNQCK